MKDILIRNAYVLPMEGAAYENGYVLVRNGTIAAVGDMSNLPINSEAEEIDAAGGWVMPGLIDIHSHLGLYEDGLGFEGADGNEDTDPVTPHLRVIDGINPMERAFRESLEAGVTAVVVSPGSANPIGGQLAAIKTWGRRIDDMVIVEPVGIKFAFGENPKGVYHDKEETPVTRMATAALIRENLRKAQEYHDRKRKALENEEEDLPDFDAKLESLELLITGKLPAHIHAHRADDIFTALRICKEFGVKPVLVHGTEGHLVADLLAEEGGTGCQRTVYDRPLQTGAAKPDRSRARTAQNRRCAGRHHNRPSRDPGEVFASRRRRGGAGGYGRNGCAARHHHRRCKNCGTGSPYRVPVPGKDADVLVLSGYPFDFRSRVQAVLSSGAIAYRRDNI